MISVQHIQNLVDCNYYLNVMAIFHDSGNQTSYTNYHETKNLNDC